MRKILLFAVLLSVVCGPASAQQYDTLFTVRQELPLPPNDSGGRWLSSAMILTSVSAYPTHVQIPTYEPQNVTAMEIADSGFYIADSIFLYGVLSTPNYRLNTPWKYIDSSYQFAQLDFLLPAHGTLRIPIRIRAFSQSGPPGDTASNVCEIYGSGDSAGTLRNCGLAFGIRCIKMYAGDYAVWQESIPSTDSGGKWMSCALIFKSLSELPFRAGFVTNQHEGYDTSWKLADSAWNMADTIVVNYNIRSGNPRHWEDSNYTIAWVSFPPIAPHGSLRVPFMVRAVRGGYGGEFAHGDTTGYTLTPNYEAYFDSTFFDSLGLPRVPEMNPSGYILLQAVEGCVGPYDAYTGTPVNNQNRPAQIGGTPIYFGPTNSSDGANFEQTTVSCKLTGEFTDRFILPDTVISSPQDAGSLEFKGAAKSPIYDTLTATYTDCWGSVTTQTPIEAYSVLPNGYQIRQLPLTVTAPFFGSTAGNAAVVINNSDFPITLRNLHATSYDSADFEASAPAMIAAHDSDYITVTLIDRDVYLDTLYPERGGTITGIIAPYQQEIGFADSTFTFSVTGAIDVYSPQYFGFYLPPAIKHGIHPKGIIFTSSVSSTQGGAGTFVAAYGNMDSTTEYFGMPYYDDPHFHITIGNYSGFGTVTLPGSVKPDTGLPPSNIEVLTTFTGDNYHNYYTQMHWPRATDTITIDVLAIGADAPPYFPPLDGVKPVAISSTISIWPNPASQLLHIKTPEQRSIRISDALGRIVLKRDLSIGYSDIDISNLPLGIYEIFSSDHQQAVKLQIFR